MSLKKQCIWQLHFYGSFVITFVTTMFIKITVTFCFIQNSAKKKLNWLQECSMVAKI